MTVEEKKGILAWLDKLIELNQEIEDTKKYNDKIISAGDVYIRKIHIVTGLKEVAEAVGAVIMWQDKTLYTFECFHINYRDYMIFTVEGVNKEG